MIAAAAPQFVPGALPAASIPGKQPGIGPLGEYHYDLRLGPDARTLTGAGSIVVHNDKSRPLDDIVLRTWANAPAFAEHGGRAAVSNVRVDGRETPFAHDGTVVRVDVPGAIPAGGDVTLEFDYSVTAPAGNSRFGQAGGMTLFGNALPTLAVHEQGAWRTHPYVPFGEAFYSLTAPWKIDLDLPADTHAVVTGTETERVVGDRRHVTAVTDGARDALIATGKDLVRRSGTVDGTEVRVTVGAVDAGRGQELLDAAMDNVAWMNRTYGAYGRRQLDIVGVRDFFAGGMEYPEATIVGLVDDPATTRHVVGHENAHQWFYSIVGNDSYREPWLDESLAEHAAMQWNRVLEPAHQPAAADAGHASALTGAERPSGAYISSPTDELVPPGANDFATGAAQISAIYGDGPRVLDGLRTAIGPDRFGRGMRSYFEGNRDQIATTANFIEHMSLAAGRDLTRWFRANDIVAHPPGRGRVNDPNGPAAPGVPDVAPAASTSR